MNVPIKEKKKEGRGCVKKLALGGRASELKFVLVIVSLFTVDEFIMARDLVSTVVFFNFVLLNDTYFERQKLGQYRSEYMCCHAPFYAV